MIGSVRSATHDDGLNANYYDYDVFGKPFGETNDYGYVGKPYDPVTGLSNYGYRDYSPKTARFTTVDPIRDGHNWYAYCSNDPVNFVDLWGLSAEDKVGKQAIYDAALDSLISTATGTVSSLSDHVDTKALAMAVSQNLQYLDPQTRAYYQGMPESIRVAVIESQLGQQTVITGVSPTEATKAAAAMGMLIDPAGGDAFSVGNNIFFFESGDPDSTTAGHEGIHGLQAIALGGAVPFLNAYNAESKKALESGNDPYFGNAYEKAAYSFGPENRQAQTNLPNGKDYIKY